MNSPNNVQQGHLYFFAEGKDANNNDVINLWISDGTEATTTLVKSFLVGDAEDKSVSAVAFRGKLYFVFDDVEISDRFWVSNGTANGTIILKDKGNVEIANPDHLFATDNWLYFTADDPAAQGNQGRELWRTDGTAAKTELFLEINPNGDANPKTMGWWAPSTFL